MAIAVRQLVIKSTVQPSEPPPRTDTNASARDIAKLRAALMEECRQMMRDELRARNER
jgi:hypothetical protein